LDILGKAGNLVRLLQYFQVLTNVRAAVVSRVGNVCNELHPSQAELKFVTFAVFIYGKDPRALQLYHVLYMEVAEEVSIDGNTVSA